MKLIEILLPVTGADGKPFVSGVFVQIRQELLDRWGGVTAHLRAPATGLWKDADDTAVRDDVVIYEVMTAEIDDAWWGEYRELLCKRLQQRELIIRAHDVYKL